MSQPRESSKAWSVHLAGSSELNRTHLGRIDGGVQMAAAAVGAVCLDAAVMRLLLKYYTSFHTCASVRSLDISSSAAQYTARAVKLVSLRCSQLPFTHTLLLLSSRSQGACPGQKQGWRDMAALLDKPVLDGESNPTLQRQRCPVSAPARTPQPAPARCLCPNTHLP